MLEDVRKYVRLGLEALSSQGSNDAPGAARARATGVAEQLSSLAAGFLEWSAEARASLLQEMKDLIARQVQEMGVATRKDLESLEGRIERLEASRGTGSRPVGKATRGRIATGARTGARSGTRATDATRAGARATSKASASRRRVASKTARSATKRSGRGRGTAARGSR
jgi:BMFP domain-containing protein YqiC